jgi:ABC-2 type transport system ATP-binding protein
MTVTLEAIWAIGLEKSYGDARVLDGVDLRIPTGTIYALLGPNGAGKTTTVRILSTLLQPDAGQAFVAGFNVIRDRAEVRRRTSLVSQDVALDELQTGRENLIMVGRLAGQTRPAARERAGELLETFDLVDAGDRRVATYSGGMRRRVDVAASLMAKPEVLFLDEPTTGLDLRSRQAMWSTIRGLAASGVTVFLTTQYLEEADQLADQVAVMTDGRIVAQGSPAELKQRIAGHRLDVTFVNATEYESAVHLLDGRVLRTDPMRMSLSIGTDGTAEQVRRFLDDLDPDRTAIGSFAVHSSTLDDVFLALTEKAYV